MPSKNFWRIFAKNDKSGLLFTPAYSPIGVGIKFLTEQENKKMLVKKEKLKRFLETKNLFKEKFAALCRGFTRLTVHHDNKHNE